MAEILNAHGSQNDIFVTALTPGDFASETDLRSFVRNLCDRSGPFGGDGVYFYDATRLVPEAWFFNPDGSAAEFCGNGMRCLGRVILDRRGIETAEIHSGPREYTVHRGATTPEGVRQVRLEHPAVDFDPDVPVVAARSPAIQAHLPELDPSLAFTAVTIPNPHLVAVIDKYLESDLVAMGELIAIRRETFPAGANLSVLLPLTPAEVFVRTFERGAGLPASCGSGMAAARAVYSRIGQADPESDVLIRNAGGTAAASLRVRDSRWFPVLEGNATFVYRADVDPVALTRAQPGRAREPGDGREPYPDEIRAYAALDEQNAARLRAVGIETASTATAGTATAGTATAGTATAGTATA
jgi:diaminopimelate epimerase